MPTQYHIAFWNLENLFDVQNSPRRSSKLQRAIGASLAGWTQVQLDQKVSQLGSIVRQMNDGHGPDMLGVCEVENKYVMDLLVQRLAPLGRNYAVAHHNMSDSRGIDVAFIYDATLFTFKEYFWHVVMRRTATRDILQVNFETRKGRLFVVLGNHWPSRSGGGLTSGYRAIAGETIAYFHQRIHEVHGADTPVLAMGDFNDEPCDSSLVDYALSSRSLANVLNAQIYRFFNLMWLLMGQGLGTLYFDNRPNLFDQFLVDRNMLRTNAPFQVQPDSAEIVRFPQMVNPGIYPSPIPFGGMGKPVNPNGFSDHFPISVVVTEES
jgi:hypothetical protein